MALHQQDSAGLAVFDQKVRHFIKPSNNPKADLDRYYMLAHGSHLVDTARYFGGDIVAVDARLLNRGGIRWSRSPLRI